MGQMENGSNGKVEAPNKATLSLSFEESAGDVMATGDIHARRLTLSNARPIFPWIIRWF